MRLSPGPDLVPPQESQPESQSEAAFTIVKCSPSSLRNTSARLTGQAKSKSRRSATSHFLLIPESSSASLVPRAAASRHSSISLGALPARPPGKLFIDGIDFAALNDAERTRMRKARIGFVFQKFNLLPTLTARGNIQIGYDIAERPEPLDPAYLDHLTDLLGIKGRLDHRPSELSGGEQQRVAIARALITRPAIILADEPTGNLDTRNSEAVLEMLRFSNREFKQTVLMITHNEEAAAIGDRILHMRDGEMIGVEARVGRAVHA